MFLISYILNVYNIIIHRPSTITQSMKDRRLAFLLGEEQILPKNKNNVLTQSTSHRSLSHCNSASGVNKKIQNRTKTESKEKMANSSTKRSATVDPSNQATSSPSIYDSAEIVAFALGKSRNQVMDTSNPKTNSNSNLRRQSSENAVPNFSKSTKEVRGQHEANEQ